MGVQLLGEKYSLGNMGAGGDKPSALSYTEVFYQCLPYYLSMGMSADEFWNCDPRMYEVYRKLDRINNEKENERLWIQAAYIYDVMLRIAPSLGLQPQKPEPFLEKPFTLWAEKDTGETPMTDEEIKKSPQFAKVTDWMLTVNKQKEQKNG